MFELPLVSAATSYIHQRKWEFTYHTNNGMVAKYNVKCVCTKIDEQPVFPAFPVSVVETGKPGSEVYKAIYTDMSTKQYTSLIDVVVDHDSIIESTETLETYGTV